MTLHSTAQVEAMLKATGGVLVQYGGRTTWGHFEHVPEALGQEPGVIASVPSLVIASDSLPEIGLHHGEGTVRGMNLEIQIGDRIWVILNIEPGTSDGEIRLMLANR